MDSSNARKRAIGHFVSAIFSVIVCILCFSAAADIKEEYGYYLKYAEDAQNQYQMFRIFAILMGVVTLVDVIMGAVALSQVQDAPVNTNLITCPDCYGRVSRYAGQCPHCGRNMATVVAAMQTSSAPARMTSSVVEQDADGRWLCICGHRNSPVQTACSKCGREKDATKPKAQYAAANAWVCVECNHVNSSNQIFCGECGRRR